MKIKAVITEKAMSEAKRGNFTFWVDFGLNKNQIKKIIADMFKVTVTRVRTINYIARQKKNIRGRNVSIPARKKAIVTLADNAKIDLFEEAKKKTKKVKKAKKEEAKK
jgi:large subunit ribosomal protein L23